MITVLTVAFHRYLQTDFEKFFQKYVEAIGLFELIANPNKKDQERLMEFEKKISKDIPVALSILDRHINPKKGEFSTVSNKLRIEYRDPNNKLCALDLAEDKIQFALCTAIREVHQIVLRNMKEYQLEQPVNDQSEPQTSSVANLFKV
jgi:hypothetical protein